MGQPRAFVSYARSDAERVVGIEKRLRQLGYDVWIDQVLKGGQTWWDEILSQIRQCDVFVAIVSPASLDSRACVRERQYADALGKPILPVAVAHVGLALPSELSKRQVVDYTQPGEDAAFNLAAVLTTLPPPPALPDPLPEPPDVPLSYLASLVDLASSTAALDKAQQMDMLDELEGGLRAVDVDERDGAWHVLAMLEERPDLYAATQRRIDRLRETYEGKKPTTPRADPDPDPDPDPEPRPPEGTAPPSGPPQGATPPPPPGPPAGQPPQRPSGFAAAASGAPLARGWDAPGPGGTRPGPPQASPPPNYLAWGIVTTVLCCLPLGVVSIVYATRVDSKWAQGDASGARAASASARTYAIWAAIVGPVAYLVIYMMLLASGDLATF